MERILKICSLGFIILFQYWLFAGGGGGGATLVTPPAGMPACVPNTAPGETSCTATPICDFNGYCGTTLGSYAADARNTPIQTAFESCLGRGVSIDNDSYLSFVASATSVTFDIYVYNCNTDQCIQLFMFSRTDCGSGTVTGHQCAYQLFARNNSYAVSVSGLTVGQTYYILIDGCSGNICDYTFVAQSGVVAPLAVNIPNNAAVCSGSNVTVTASGGLGSYTWSGASGLSATSGSTVTITPPATPGTYNYKVTASGGTAMCPQSLEHDFSIVVSGLPTITGNTTLCVGETSDLNATGEWAALPTGGTITTVGNERIHRFTSNGTFTTTNPINSARYLVVGGGGGACGDVGGGAGGGGVRQGISSAPSGSNAVVVGAGGAGAAAGNSNSGNAQNGGNSSVFGIIAQGGGRGGNYQGAGANGATGGGGGGGGVTAGGTGIAGQGYAGGSGATGSSPYKSGGGGGAGGIGGSASSSAGGNGGNGIASDISGTLTYYGGGGGGGCGDGGTPGTGGLGGGGNGKNRATNSPGNNGTANTGGGGGGNAHPHYGGASGGSGIVFVRYRPPVWTSSNTAVATVNSMTGVVTAVSSGTSNITFTNEHGCSSSTTITVNPSNLTPVFTNPGPICSGAALSLPTTSNNSITGTWSPAVNNTTTTTYTFTPAAGQCSAVTTTMTVTVNPLVTPTFNNPGPICSGTALTLPTTSNNSITGTWSPAVNNTATTTYTFTPTAGQCAATTTMTVTVNPLVTPTFTNPGPICSGATLTLPTTSNNSIAGTWSPAVNNTTTTTYTFTPTAGQCAATTTMTVTVNPLVTPTFNNPGPICSGDALTLPTTSNNSIAGTWSPTVNNTATTTYTFTPTAGQCAATTTMTVTVNPLVTPTFNNPGPICSGDALTLPTTSNNSIAGTWSPAVNNTATTTYTFTPTAGQCAATTTMTVTVTPLVTPTFNNPGPICSGVALTLPTTSNNSITGTWSPAVNNTATTTYTFTPTAGQCAATTTMTVTVNPLVTPTFNNPGPICSGATLTLPTTSSNSIAGTWSPAVNNTATTTYTFTPTAGQCAATTTMTVTVNNQTVPTFTNPGSICSGTTLTLSTTSNNGITGTWSPAVNNTATTTYTFAPDAGQCAATTTMTVTVTPLVTPTFTNPGPICSGVALTLPTTSNNGITGTWSPAVNNTATTTYTFAPDAGQCATSETMTVTVTPLVTPTFNNPGPICSGATLTLPTTSSNSIAGTWSPAVNNTATTTYTFTPTAGQCATTTTMTVTVNPLVTPTFNNPGPICSGATLTLPTTSNNSIAGIWSPAVNNTATTTYTFTPTAGQCAATTTMTVTVNPLVTPTFNNPGPICSGATLTLPTTSNNSIAGTWSPAVNNTATTTYTFTPTAGQCAATTTMMVTVTQAPTATIAYSGPFCTSENTEQAVTITGSTGGSYTSSPSGLTINSSTGAITPSSSTSDTYTVTYTVAAGGGCPAFTTTATVTVTALPVISITPVTPVCTSSAAVTLAATPAGGTWSGSGVSGSSFDPATATVGSNTITYTVPAAAGCPAVDQNITITVTQAPTATIAYAGPFCTSENTEQAVTITGSTGGSYTSSPSGLTINSSNGAITPSSSTPDTYTVTYTVAAGGGCPAFTTTANITIGELPTVSITPTDIINNCQVGGSTGSAVITATGGYPTYEYSLTGGAPYQSSNSFTGLTSNNYTVTVRDANGCTTTQTFTITDPAGGTPLSATINPTDIINNCQVGGSTGSVVITATGGYPTYEYSLTGGAPYQSSNSFTGLTSNNYTVTVRDANGCTTTQTFTITDPAGGTPLSATISPTDIINNCQVGGSTGSAVITATGGYPTYEYSLTGGAPYQSSNSFTGLTSNNYTVTVRDANGCTTTQTFTITDPAGGTPLSATINPTDIINNCQVGGSTGSAVITATGGYPNYEYSLTGGAPYQSSNSFTGLTSNNYTVTVRDANGCTTTQTFTITDPAGGTPLSATISPTDIINNCQVGGSTGSAVITATGGYPTYEYSLTGGAPYQSSNSFTGLTSNNYTVTVRDANGCTTTQTFTITDPAGGTPLSATISPTDIINNCQVGGSTGSAVITAAGGYPNYEYSLTGGAPYQSSNSFTGLTSNNYTVTVRDANGCTTTQTFTITDPAGGTPLSATINPTDIINNCQVGGSTGSAVITATGGYPTYEYSLTGGAPYQSSNSFTGLTSNNYTVTVRDANGCTTTQTFTITDPAGGTPLSATINPTDIINNCQVGGSTGSAVITATGGYPNYEYSLTGGAPYQSSNSFTGLTSNNYTVTVRDANGCTTTQTFTITDPAGGTPLSATISPTDIINNCQVGGSTGSAVITATGGYPTYEYSLTGGAPYQSSNSFTGLTSNNYTVTVRDANGCTTTQTFTITDPAGGTPLSATINPTDIINNCQVGGSTGSAVITATGGYPNYEYSLTGGAPYQSSNSFTGLTSNNYTVTVRDANGCTTTQTFTITDPAGGTPLSATISPTDIINNCQVGGSTGSAVITATGGYPNYEYSLTGGAPYQTSNSFTGLTSNNYTVTVRDANGCTTTQTFTITDPAGGTPLSATISPTDIINNCQVGGSNGSAVITATGGYPNYEYSLTGGAPYQTSNSFTGLTSNNYTVTVRDANGCTTTQTFTITDPAGGTPLSATINPNNIINNCQVGGSNGSAVITAAGGYPTYEYSLTGGAPYQTSNSFTGLTSNNYTVTVRDANGCTTTQTFTITDPAGGTPLSATISPTDIINNCQVGGSNGSAVITAAGGYPNYEYSLTGGAPYQTSNSFTGLTSNNYTVTVRDANGCTTTQTFTITDPAGGTPLSATISPTDIINNCQVGGSNGSAVITAAGGYPNYEYSLTGGAPYQTSNSFTGLTSNNYTVTVRDANGCTTTQTFTITDPAGGTPLSATISPTDIINNCQVGGSNGSAVITAAGGYPNYEYSLTGGAPYQTSNSFTGLTSNNYTVTVRDANGCTTTQTFTITDPAGGTPLSATISPTDIINNCQVGGSNGSAVITATGGYPNYEYSLTGGAPYQTPNSFTGLTSNNYTVTVRDANGCTTTQTFTITDPAGGTPLSATINPNNIINNCQVGGSNGSAVITAAGGYPNYEYSLTGGAPYQTSNSFTGLTSNNYTVTVRDANGCTTTQTFTITDPAGGTPLSATISPTDIINNCQVGGSTGSAVITATGGYPNYEYSLTGGAPYQSSNSFTGLTSNNYTVTVRDANGCTTTQTFTITDPAGGTPLSATINPTDIINNCQVGGSTGSAVITATGGYPNYEYSLTGGAPYQSSNSFTGLTSNNYTVTVRDANGCTTTQTFTITDPAGGTPLSATISPTDIINNCQVGGSTGSAVITATGGYPNYEYSLTGGAPYQTSNSFTGLTSNNYTVTVRDANGCTTTQTFTITDPAGGTPLSATISPTDIINNCQVGGSNGSAVITATGGYPNYEYSLTGGAPYQTSNSFTGLTSNNYTVTVRDANGCTTTQTFTITDPAGGTPLSATINPNNIINNCQVGGSNGSAVITAAGGYPTYEYSLTGGAPYQTSNSFTGLTSNNYTVTVRDANGCTTTQTFTITDPAGGTPLSATISPTDIINNCQVGGSNGSAVITATGGYPNYEYSLTGGAPYQTSNSFTGLTSNNYTVTVRDANGCTTTQTFTITDPAGGTPLSATISPTDIINNCQVGGSNGSAVITATGGYPNYEYSLTGGAPYQTSNSFTGLTSNNYTVTVRDANGCTTTQTFTITDPAGGTPLSATISPTDIINNCQVGGSTGSAVITATGGYPNYEYSLTGGAPYQTSNSFTGLTSNNYTVTVRDANGCTTTQTFTITDIIQTASISGSTTVCQQSTSPVVTFTGSGATAPYTFTYTINGGAAQTVTSTGNTATVSVPTTTAGTFTYVLTGVSESSATACSNPATGSVSIVVNPKPVVTLNAAAASICSGSGVSITPASTPAGATFSWTAANNNTSGANSGTGTIIAENLTATTTAAGTATYTVTGTLNGCTSDPANSVITVNPMPVASAQGQTICSGTSTNVALSSNIPGTTFSWTVAPSGVSGASNGSGSSINQMLTSLTGGSVTYTITPTAGNCSATPPISVVVDVQAMPAIAVTPANSSICQGDQVTLTATGGVTYTWTPSIGLSATTGATVTATPSATTTYIVTGASSAGCTGTSQTVVTVNNYPNVTISSDIPVSPNVTVCLGTPVTLTASGAATYTWSPVTGLTSASGAVVTANPSTTTTYTVSATSNGCTSTESVTITVNPIPVVSAGPDITVCKGSKVILNATGAVSYSWSDGVTNLVPFTADTTRTYTVTGTSEHGCTNTDYITVFVTEAPEVAFTAGRITGCVPLHIQFENLSQGATSYLWSFGDGTTSTLEDAFHDYEQNGCFDVTLTAYNTYGCSTAVKMDSMICTLPSPTAAFVASTYEITNVINEVQFNNMSEGATSYQWYFGDETGYSTKEHPKYTYDPNIFRNYNVILVATNQDGCTDTARVVIRMSEDVVFYVPNSFTPDGDNFNNVFKPVFVEGFDAFEYDMLIFNRWGEVIFETHDINYGWDGTYLFNGGKLCPDGTYVWKITVKKTGVDDRVEKTGHVTLVR